MSDATELTDDECEQLAEAGGTHVELLVQSIKAAAYVAALEDAANWYETPVVSDNYPGFAAVLRANAAKLKGTL